MQPCFLIGQAKRCKHQEELAFLEKKNRLPICATLGTGACVCVLCVCDSLGCSSSALVAGHTCIFSYLRYGQHGLIEMRDDASDRGTCCLAILQSASWRIAATEPRHRPPAQRCRLRSDDTNSNPRFWARAHPEHVFDLDGVGSDRPRLGRQRPLLPHPSLLRPASRGGALPTSLVFRVCEDAWLALVRGERLMTPVERNVY